MSVAVRPQPGTRLANGPAARIRNARPAMVVAALAGIVALVIPPEGFATWLVGDGSPRLAEVIQGAWLLKAAILAHAIAVPLLTRAVAAAPDGAPLLVTGSADAEVPRAWMPAAVLALVLVALALRLIDLDTGLWHDEIATLLDSVRLQPRAIVATYTAQNQHVLYSLLARLTFAIFGESAWSLRLPAAVLGAASLAATWWFATLVTTRREALLALALLTVSYHHVWFSQNGRGYTGLMLFAALGSGLFLQLLRGSTPNAWRTIVLYALTMALAAYTHLTAAFIAVAHASIWAFLAWTRRGEAARRPMAAPAIAILLAATFTFTLYALVIPQMAETLLAPKAEFAETPWRNPLWLIAETVRGASRGLPGGWIGFTAGLTVAAAGTISYLRRSAAVTALMVAPIALTGIVLVVLGHNLWPRFFFFGAGFMVLVAVRGVFALSQRLPGRAALLVPTVALVLAAAASATTVPRAWAPKQDYAAALEYVQRERSPGDGVAAAGLAAYAYEDWLGAPVDAVTDVAGLERIEQSHPRTWLLYAFPTHLESTMPAIWERLQREYRTVAEFPATVAGGTVTVMIRP